VEKHFQNEFYNKKDSKDGKMSHCKECNKKKGRDYYKKHQEERKAKAREWYRDNPEKSKESNRKWRQENPERERENCRRWAKNNPERKKEIANRYARENRHVIRKWEQDNAEYVREYKRNYISNRYKTNTNYRLKVIMRANLKRVLKDVKDKTTVETLGYGPKQLKSKIEMQFTDGMSWGNYGDWHIDHKIPIQYFLNKGETRPHIINSLANLQPLWAKDNLSKSDRIPSDFQG